MEEEEGVHCYCEQKNDVEQPMICCDRCLTWYHFSCLGFSPEEEDFWSSEASRNIPWNCKDCFEIRDDGKRTSSIFLDLEAAADSDEEFSDEDDDQPSKTVSKKKQKQNGIIETSQV